MATGWPRRCCASTPTAAQTAKREVRLLSRFTGANPHVPVVGVPSLPFDVSDLDALQAIADQITGETG